MQQGRRQLSQRDRWDMLQAAGFRCQYCGQRAPGVVLQVDHRMPLAAGGSNHPENLVIACSACNAGKSDTPPQTVRWRWRAIEHNPLEDANLCMGNHRGPFMELFYGPTSDPWMFHVLACEACGFTIAEREPQPVEVRAA